MQASRDRETERLKTGKKGEEHHKEYRLIRKSNLSSRCEIVLSYHHHRRVSSQSVSARLTLSGSDVVASVVAVGLGKIAQVGNGLRGPPPNHGFFNGSHIIHE